MLEDLKKMMGRAFDHRLSNAMKYVHNGRKPWDTDMYDWVTIELLEQHTTFPYHLAPPGHRTYVMNLRPKDVDFWAIGKAVQRREPMGVIDFECVAEIQAGYWEFLRHECGLTEEE